MPCLSSTLRYLYRLVFIAQAQLQPRFNTLLQRMNGVESGGREWWGHWGLEEGVVGTNLEKFRVQKEK